MSNEQGRKDGRVVSDIGVRVAACERCLTPVLSGRWRAKSFFSIYRNFFVLSH
ncbi:MAG: hypothetical protein LBK25_02575 [Treponema sp.]|nr:hypothetical protein [Treponema sp.]